MTVPSRFGSGSALIQRMTVKAQMRQEDVLAGEGVPVEAPKGVSRVTLASAVEDFLAERSTQTDERGLKRWRWELELFEKVCGKTYLHEVSRADCFAYMKWFQIRKKKPRTVYNRMVGLGVFLKAAKHTVDSVFSQRKDNGQIPDYSEKTVDRYTTLDLKSFFAACDAEARLRYLFFLDTGCREREVMFACQEDFMFEAKDSECASTYEVCPEARTGFQDKEGQDTHDPADATTGGSPSNLVRYRWRPSLGFCQS